MQYAIEDAVPLLRRTPSCLSALLQGLPEAWVRRGTPAGGWSPYGVVGHLIHGERTDWLPRTLSLLDHGEAVTWPPFDRQAQDALDQSRSIGDLLDEFATLRQQNVDTLLSLELSPEHWSRTALHPEFGRVTLSQLLSTWVVHDLSHTSQIARTMATQYTDQVGPWATYIPILNPA